MSARVSGNGPSSCASGPGVVGAFTGFAEERPDIWGLGHSGSPQRLTSDSRSFDPSMFGDASRVAFIYYGGKFNDGASDEDAHEVRVLDLSSGRVRTVAKDLYDAGDLAVSPDMMKYVLTMILGDEYRLAIGDIAGESEPNPIEITGVDGSPRIPAWSPDGTRLAFSAPREIKAEDADLAPTFREQVAVVSAAGGRAQVLFETRPGGSVPTIVWSPDGTRLLVTSSIGPRRVAAIEIDVATGVVQPLVQGEDLREPVYADRAGTEFMALLQTEERKGAFVVRWQRGSVSPLSRQSLDLWAARGLTLAACSLEGAASSPSDSLSSPGDG